MSLAVSGLLVLATLIYGAFTLVIIRGLLLKTTPGRQTDLPAVAVVIAARNEAQNLPGLLADLAAQDYPGQVDIYLADDRSTDATWSILARFAKQHPNIHPIKITALSEQMTPKKHALTQCLKQTTAELILSTDADCRVGPGWVASAVAQFDEKTGILIGYSQVAADKLFEKYQALDFAGIMVANAGMTALGYAWSGSGQNLAYRRSAFTAIGGFNEVAYKSSGDDVFLVQTIPAKTGLKAKFNFDPQHFVSTRPMSSVWEFVMQRIRWASNSRGVAGTDRLFFGFLVSAFLTNLLLLMAPFLGTSSELFGLVIAVKFVFEGAVLLTGARRFTYRSLLLIYPLWFVLQPLYITVVGLLGWRGKYRWKP